MQMHVDDGVSDTSLQYLIW